MLPIFQKVYDKIKDQVNQQIANYRDEYNTKVAKAGQLAVEQIYEVLPDPIRGDSAKMGKLVYEKLKQQLEARRQSEQNNIT